MTLLSTAARPGERKYGDRDKFGTRPQAVVDLTGESDGESSDGESSNDELPSLREILGARSLAVADFAGNGDSSGEVSNLQPDQNWPP